LKVKPNGSRSNQTVEDQTKRLKIKPNGSRSNQTVKNQIKRFKIKAFQSVHCPELDRSHTTPLYKCMTLALAYHK
jgi:hypothetical protein